MANGNGNQEKTNLQKMVGHGYYLIKSNSEENPETLAILVLLMDQARFGTRSRATLKTSIQAAEVMVEINRDAVERLGRELKIETDPKKVAALRQRKADAQHNSIAFAAVKIVAERLDDPAAPALLVEQADNGTFQFENPVVVAERFWDTFFRRARRTKDIGYVKANADLVSDPIVDASIMSADDWDDRYSKLLNETFGLKIEEDETDDREDDEPKSQSPPRPPEANGL